MLNKRHVKSPVIFYAILLTLSACGGSSDLDVVDTDVDTDDDTDNLSIGCADTATLHEAFQDFGANVEIILDADNCFVTLEATGKPDHTSPYWDPNGTSGLYEAPGDETDVSQMSPGYIDNFGTQLYSMTVSTEPELANTTTATSLGAAGIAVSGAPIFNDQEGPNINLDIGVISGFDRNGAHTGPETYHYHLEPKAISDDDYSLIGLMADGFFIYGRKCYSSDDYPSDLDASGGHSAITQHSQGEAEYHYHVQDELYLSAYYLLFPGDYQGTPVSISR